MTCLFLCSQTQNIGGLHYPHLPNPDKNWQMQNDPHPIWATLFQAHFWITYQLLILQFNEFLCTSANECALNAIENYSNVLFSWLNPFWKLSNLLYEFSIHVYFDWSFVFQFQCKTTLKNCIKDVKKRWEHAGLLNHRAQSLFCIFPFDGVFFLERLTLRYISLLVR